MPVFLMEWDSNGKMEHLLWIHANHYEIFWPS